MTKYPGVGNARTLGTDSLVVEVIDAVQVLGIDHRVDAPPLVGMTEFQNHLDGILVAIIGTRTIVPKAVCHPEGGPLSLNPRSLSFENRLVHRLIAQSP